MDVGTIVGALADSYICPPYRSVSKVLIYDVLLPDAWHKVVWTVSAMDR